MINNPATMQTPRIPFKDMPVVILCGGKGTRLREETEYRPKPMVEIGRNPILWHIMKLYGHYGFERFILCLGYKGWVIKQFFLRYHEYESDLTIHLDGSRPPDLLNRPAHEPWRVTCAETGEETATGARLWRVREYVDTDTFLFTYGDAVGDVDIPGLLDLHWREGRTATVTGVHPTSRYGEMRVEGHRALEFNEKPTIAEGFVSGGFFVFERSVFDQYLDPDPQLFLELEPLRNLARDGELTVYPHEGFWHPMDTYRDYLHLNELWKQERPPWRIW